MRHHALPEGVTRESLIDWYRGMRARTRKLFDLITPDAYYDRPIGLRNPIVFYEGHLPALAVNTLVKLAHKRAGVDEHYETLFARGIDPEDEESAQSPADAWPSRKCVQEYGAAAEALIVHALAELPLEDERVPQLRGGEAVFTLLEHELMHQETLLYMLHQLPYAKKCYQGNLVPRYPGTLVPKRIPIARGRATLGQHPGVFGWDNEFGAHVVDVDAFEIDQTNVTNGQYLDYMDATGARAPHFWMKNERGEWLYRGVFEAVPLPLGAPVYVTYDEAAAYAAWNGARLPSEAEYHRAAFGTPSGEEREYPWGGELPDASRGNFDFASFDPVAAGANEQGASAWGVLDLVGNGWEWTSTLFHPFDGFEPMASYPPYSTDFFDGAHYVMKGASPVTPRQLVRRSFRNWFRPNYPYVYATFRCAR